MTHRLSIASVSLQAAVVMALAIAVFVMAPGGVFAEEPPAEGTQVALPFVMASPVWTSPEITTSPAETASAGMPYTYAIRVAGYPTPTLSLDIGPPGMTVDANGNLQWTPADAGSYAVSLRASNGIIPDAEQAWAIAVSSEPYAPSIASTPPTTGAAGVAYTYQVEANGNPQPSVTLDVAPAGMTVDANGLIQWTPAATGLFSVTVRASNGITPDALQPFAVDVAEGPQPVAPTITSSPVISGAAGTAYVYQVQATGYPSPTITLDEAPAGMTVDLDGLIQWTPAAAGSFSVTVRASNGVAPDAVQPFALDISEGAQTVAPTITSAPVTTGAAGTAYAYQVQAAGVPDPTISLDEAPAGMTVDANGLIRWTPPSGGIFSVTVRAGNSVAPDALQPFAIHVSPPPRIWDPRLDQRYASLVEASVASGQRYWRLIEARWLDEVESNGDHHIFMEVLDETGQRMVNVRLRVSWEDGFAFVWSEEKPGERFGANFPMAGNLAPAYAAKPDGDNPNHAFPADRVEGMGLGSIEQPDYTIHASYELTWQLAVMP